MYARRNFTDEMLIDLYIRELYDKKKKYSSNYICLDYNAFVVTYYCY